jgi:thymidylate synthase (FAD)
MRLIKPSFEIIEQQAGLEGMYKQIELAGRTCYKSEDKITEDSAKGFVERMIKSGHGAMLEHGTVYLLIPYEEAIDTIGDDWVHEQYSYNPYSVVAVYGNNYYITTNFRVLVENNWMDDLKYICEPTEHHEKRVTVRFICDRGVSHEFVRHRVMSFAQESTRYCNYSKDKFGNELTFIEPCWLEDYNYKDNTYNQLFIDSLRFAEAHYLDLLKKWDDKIPDKRYKTGFRNNPWTPQQARAVLPNSLKTELVVTGFVSDWKHFFELRCASNAHPQAQELAIPLREEFVKRGYIK